MTYGMIPTGFLGKPATVCRTEMATALQSKRGASVDVSDSSFEGQFIAILAEREGDIWGALQALYAAGDPDQATDAAQDALCTLSGTFRSAAASSLVTSTLTGTSTTVVPQGTQFKTSSTGALFATTASGTLAAPTAWVASTVYTVGNRRSSNGQIYQCTVAGTSSSGTGPAGTFPGTGSYFVTDGTVTWLWLGTGTGVVDVLAASVTKDAIVANALDLNIIATPVGGLANVINVVAATLGRPLQSNQSLRVTRELELAQDGSGTAAAIQAQLLTVTGVTACTVFHNDTDSIDSNGQAPHSVQCLVLGGADTDVANSIYANIGAGIATIGTSSVTVTDSAGNPQIIRFIRVTAIPIYVDVTLTYNPSLPTRGGYPTTGDALVQTAVATFANTVQVPGKDVVASSIAASIFPLYVNGTLVAGVQGVLDVTSVKISTAPSPTVSTTISITGFQQATMIVANITVHSSAGVV